MAITLTIIVVLVLFLQYTACVALYHANTRRSKINLIIRSEPARTVLKIAALCILAVSIFLCASLQGWERGVPIWLCLIGVTGFISLYVSAYKPSVHIKSGVASLVVALLLSGVFLFIDSPQEKQQQVTQRPIK